jgi:hypothetical protein
LAMLASATRSSYKVQPAMVSSCICSPMSSSYG